VRRLDAACDRVIVDHYLIGDGSKNGLRTKRTNFPQLLGGLGFRLPPSLAAFSRGDSSGAG
jgi:hypothetical protein